MREKTTNTANRGNKKKKHHQQTRSQTSSSFFFFSFVFVSLLVREHRQRIRSLDYHQVALIQLISDTFPVAWRHGRPAVWFRWAFPLVPIDSRTIAVSRYQITVEKRWNIKLDVISNSCRNSYLHLHVFLFEIRMIPIRVCIVLNGFVSSTFGNLIVEMLRCKRGTQKKGVAQKTKIDLRF